MTITVFVPGGIINTKHHSLSLWKHRRLVKSWRERTGHYLLAELVKLPRREWPWPTSAPKQIHFHAQTWNALDADGLRVALSPCLDAMRDMRIVLDDAERFGHRVIYTQAINRAERGVRITITRARAGEEEGAG